MNIYSVILFIASFGGALFIPSCAHDTKGLQMQVENNIGFELYEEVREIPASVWRDKNYSAAIVYNADRESYFRWKHNYISNASRSEWDQFVQEAVRLHGTPDQDHSPRDLLTYQLEPVLR